MVLIWRPKRRPDWIDILELNAVLLDGYHGDNARTVGVGTVPDESAALARVCLESIEKAIEVVGPGVNYHDLATTIFECAHREAQTPTVLSRPSLLIACPRRRAPRHFMWKRFFI